MKSTFFILACLLLLPVFSHGQTFAFSASATNQLSPAYSPLTFQKSQPDKKRCGVSVAGISATSGGAAVMCVSIAIGLSGFGRTDPERGQLATNVFTTGAFITGAGIGLLIGGLIHDHHQRKLEVKSTRKNEVGLAFNF
jgi:hypothetical protein